MSSLIKAALGLVKKGFSVVASGSDKRAIVQWKKYQQALATPADLQAQFSLPNAHGLAIICGKISGGLEVVDVDTKYDLAGTLFENLCSTIADYSTGLLDRLLIIETRSGGKHLYYHCDTIEGNQKLAQRPPTEEELRENPNEKVLVLIETRGEGGYVIAPPTEGYRKIQGDTVQKITPAQREGLLEICRSFNQYIIEQPRPIAARQVNENFAVTPWDDYNNRGVDHMLQVLTKHGWTVVKQQGQKIIFKRPGKSDSKTSGDYSYEHNLFTVFTTSSEFEAMKGYKPFGVYAKLEHRDDAKAAARALISLGYGEKPVAYESRLERELFQKKQDGYSKEDLIKVIAARDRDGKINAPEMIDNLSKKWGERLSVFWDVEIDKDNKKKIHINRTRFIQFLRLSGGFGLYFYDKNSTIYRIVRMVDGFVEEASTEQMKKFILEYIDALPDTFDGGITPELLKELVMKQYNALFNDAFLEFCERVDPDFLKDELGKAYFPFRNGVVVVTKDKTELVSYGSIKKYIWKSQVIDFNISVVDEDFQFDQSEFYKFLQKISGDDEKRLMYAVTLIGYLMHKYKDPSTPFSVILAEETETEAEGGGTGKGILVKAISYMMNTERVDGKNFKLDKNFAFQRVNLDTKLISIEDVRKNVDFEGFFSIITEGITVEKKNKDELYIPFKDSPKIMFTTNYTISSSTKAAQRRQRVFEFAPFFGPGKTPRDFFGHNLFDEWDMDEWNRFYNLMFECVKQYFIGGIMQVVNSDKLKRKHIKLSFGEEFLEWFDDYHANGCIKWKPFKELYNGFKIENDFDSKEFSQKRFKKALETAAEIFGNRVQTRRNRVQNNVHEVRLEHDKAGNHAEGGQAVLDNSENVLDAF
jgi:hypothetical protein